MTAPSSIFLDFDRPTHPARVAEDVLLLLETGRPAMALTIARELPEAIRAFCKICYEEGRWRGRKAAERDHPAPASRQEPEPVQISRRRRRTPEHPGRHRRTALAVAEAVQRLGADGVAAVLNVRPDDLGPMLEGRVELAASALARLRRAGGGTGGKV